jgi:hypothetical protein
MPDETRSTMLKLNSPPRALKGGSLRAQDVRGPLPGGATQVRRGQVAGRVPALPKTEAPGNVVQPDGRLETSVSQSSAKPSAESKSRFKPKQPARTATRRRKAS